MRRIFGSRPTRFGRGDAVRLKTALPIDTLERGTVGTISEVRRTKVRSYDVQFISTNGVVGRFVVDESDLMPTDGRKYDDNDVARLTRDVPSRGLKTGTVGIVFEVAPGPPVEYTVDFVDANGTLIARTTLADKDLASPDEAPARDAGASGGTAGGPDETGLADDQLDELIAELRFQGQAMQQESAQQRATQERAAQAGQDQQAEQRAQQPEKAQQQQAREEPVAQAPVQSAGGGRQVDDTPPSTGRTIRFHKERVGAAQRGSTPRRLVVRYRGRGDVVDPGAARLLPRRVRRWCPDEGRGVLPLACRVAHPTAGAVSKSITNRF